MKEKVVNFFILMTSGYLFLLGIYSIYSNTVYNFHFVDTITFFLSLITMIFFLIGYILFFFFKRKEQYKYFIAITLTIYTLIIIGLGGGKDIVPALGFYLSLIYFIMIKTKIKNKVIYIFSALFVLLILRFLFHINIIKGYVEPDVVKQLKSNKLVIVTSIDFLVVGVMAGSIFLADFFKTLFYSKKKIPDPEYQIIEILKENPNLTNAEISRLCDPVITEQKVKRYFSTIYRICGITEKAKGQSRKKLLEVIHLL